MTTITTAPVYEPGDLFNLGDAEYQVVGVGLDRLCARNTATAQVMFFTAVDLLPTARPGSRTSDFNPLDPMTALLTVPEPLRELARFWLAHLNEITSGIHPDHPHRRRARYQPTVSKAARLKAKAAEMSAIRWPDGKSHPVSERTLSRKLKSLREGGPAALVRQQGRLRRPGGNQDPELIRILDQVLNEYVDLSDVPSTVLNHRTRLAYEDSHPEADFDDPSAEHYVKWPSDSTFRRLIDDRGAHLFIDKNATARRSAVKTPQTVHEPTLPARPGSEVIVDTTVLDVLCLNESGKTLRPHLTVMIDKMTRSITGWIITIETPNATDLAIMLAESLVPYPLRDGTQARYSLAASRLPGKQMIALDERMEAARALPLIPPERIVLDNGKAFRSEVFRSISSAFGISLTWCNPYSPWEKGVVERLFRTINTGFTSYFMSYVGTDVTHRGDFNESQVTLPVEVVRELFEEWVIMVYQTHPHASLCDLETPKKKLSPNEVAAASLAYAPRFAMPLTDRMLYRAYPVRWQKVLHYGIQIDQRRYDSSGLDDLRHRPSGDAAHEDRYEVRYNPHHRSCIWVRNPRSDEWITAYVTRYREIDTPCADEQYQPPHSDDSCYAAETMADVRRMQRAAESGSKLLSRRAARRAAANAEREQRISRTHTPQPPTTVDDDEQSGNGESSAAAAPSPETARSPEVNHTPWSV